MSTVTVNITDDDGVIMFVNGGNDEVIEGDATPIMYSVFLTQQPTDPVILTASFDAAQINLSVGTLTFTPARVSDLRESNPEASIFSVSGADDADEPGNLSQFE